MGRQGYVILAGLIFGQPMVSFAQGLDLAALSEEGVVTVKVTEGQCVPAQIDYGYKIHKQTFELSRVDSRHVLLSSTAPDKIPTAQIVNGRFEVRDGRIAGSPVIYSGSISNSGFTLLFTPVYVGSARKCIYRGTSTFVVQGPSPPTSATTVSSITGTSTTKAVATSYDGQWTGTYVCRGFTANVLADVAGGAFSMKRFLTNGAEIVEGQVRADGSVDLSGRLTGSREGEWTSSFAGKFSGEKFDASGRLQGRIQNECQISLNRTFGTASKVDKPNSGGSAAATSPVISPGLTADEIEAAKVVQRSLKTLNLYGGAVDGSTGPMTLAAIKNWQAANGYKVDGALTVDQRAILEKQAIGSVGTKAIAQAAPNAPALSVPPSAASPPSASIVLNPVAKDRLAVLSDLASSQVLASLFEGSRHDALVFFNEVAAPNGIRELNGRLVFGGATASQCFLGQWEADRDFELWLVDSLKERAIDTIQASSVGINRCQAIPRDRVDLFVMQRSFFAEGALPQVREFLAALKNRQVSQVMTASHTEFAAILKGRDEAAQRNLSWIKEKSELGFGMLLLNASGRQVCGIEGEAKELIEESFVNFNKLERRALHRHQGKIEVLVRTPNEVFLAVKRGNCRYVVAEAATLSVLEAALRRDGITAGAAPGWLSVTAFDDLRSKVKATMDSARVIAAEKARQEAEARAKKEDAITRQAEAEKIEAERTAQLAKLRQKADEERRQVEVMAMREKVKSRANAIETRTTTELREWIRSPSAVALDQEFRNFARWYSDRVDERWEFKDATGSVVNFGTANWRGRTVEAVSIQIDFPLSNRVIGERRTDCFVFSFINDEEFSMRRQTSVVQCPQYQETFDAWALKNGFVSQWK